MDISKNKSLSRRKFFSLLTKTALSLAGALGLVGLVRYFSFRPDPGPPTIFELGLVSDFPPGSRTLRLDIPAVIYNWNGQFFALSLSCTHLGCALEEHQEGFSCPCHGSRFDQNGQMLVGPADENLPKLQVEIQEEGFLVLHTKGAGR